MGELQHSLQHSNTICLPLPLKVEVRKEKGKVNDAPSPSPSLLPIGFQNGTIFRPECATCANNLATLAV